MWDFPSKRKKESDTDASRTFDRVASMLPSAFQSGSFLLL